MTLSAFVARAAAAAVLATITATGAVAQDRPQHSPGMMQGQGPGGPGMMQGPRGEGMGEHRPSRHLSLLDTNDDGRVTLDEIKDEHKRLLFAADVDGDGKLSVEEFRRRGNLFQALSTTTLFDLLDANGDGTLSAEEIDAPSQRWFKRYDANNDGALTADEMRPRRERHR